MQDSFLEIRHNMEVAHRLYDFKGRCEQIHGHSMWVTLRVYGKINDQGALMNHYGKPMDFGAMKKALRQHMDERYDHHLLLNENDPWAQPLDHADVQEQRGSQYLPGLIALPRDPTTENLALWIGSWAQTHFFIPRVQCIVQETSVNAAGVILGGE